MPARIGWSSAARRSSCSSAAASRCPSSLAIGVSPQSVRNWARQIDIDGGKAAGLTSDEREELRRLRRENRILTEEREDPEKRGGLLRQGQRDPVTVFGFHR